MSRAQKATARELLADSVSVAEEEAGRARIILYAPDGIDLLPHALSMRAPILVALGGDVRPPPGTSVLWPTRLEALLDMIRALSDLTAHEWGTVVISSLDSLARLIEGEVVANNNASGFGAMGFKGKDLARDVWTRRVLHVLRALSRSLDVVILAHSAMVTTWTPDGRQYHTADLRIGEPIGALVREWSTDLLYVDTADVSRARGSLGDDLAEAEGFILHARRTALATAKNSRGLCTFDVMPALSPIYQPRRPAPPVPRAMSELDRVEEETPSPDGDDDPGDGDNLDGDMEGDILPDLGDR